MADDDDMPERAGSGRSEPVIVAISASAGGVRALQGLFAAMHAHTGAAFVVIVHLDPDRRSELANIISSRTPMPAVQVQRLVLAGREDARLYPGSFSEWCRRGDFPIERGD